MLSMEEHKIIKILYEKGMSIRRISKIMNISRNTVRKYIKRKEPPKYGSSNLNKDDNITKPGRSKSKWEKYRDEIIDMYYNKKFIGTRIYEELKEKGAEGSLNGLYDYLKKIKKNDIAKKVRARFETKPGKQIQFDWSDYVVKIDGVHRKIYVYIIILAWSRYKFCIGSYNKNQESIFVSIEKALRDFGGVTEEILTDNAKQMVIEANPKKFMYNQQYVRFLSYYDMIPKVCKIKHSWTKGKVENPFSYLEEHFIKGNEFKDLKEFNERLKAFTSEWNNKKNQGINEIPSKRYEIEKEYLKELPTYEYVGVEYKWRKVSNDCLISYGGNRYSVPYVYAFDYVWIKNELGEEIKIYSQKGKLIAKHRIPETKGNTIINKDHYKGLIKRTNNSSKYIKEKFIQYFPRRRSYLETVEMKSNGWKRQINKILDLLEIYKQEDIEKAIESSIRHNVYSYNYIIAYMREHCDIEYKEYTTIFNKNIEITGIQRSLKYYEEIT